MQPRACVEAYLHSHPPWFARWGSWLAFAGPRQRAPVTGHTVLGLSVWRLVTEIGQRCWQRRQEQAIRYIQSPTSISRQMYRVNNADYYEWQCAQMPIVATFAHGMSAVLNAELHIVTDLQNFDNDVNAQGHMSVKY
eukprot:1422471-Amphidinium_carterae.1